MKAAATKNRLTAREKDATTDWRAAKKRAAANLAAAQERLAAREKKANPEAIERVTGDAQESPDNAPTPEPVQAEVTPGRTGRPWKTVALVVGGGLIGAAGAVVVTLGATHKSAVVQNAAAYVNGWIDCSMNQLYDPHFDLDSFLTALQ